MRYTSRRYFFDSTQFCRLLQCLLAAFVVGTWGIKTAHAGMLKLTPGPATSKDIWTTSVYSYAPEGGGPGGGLNNDLLRVGGWGDQYYSLMEFDLSRAPTDASSVKLQLYNTGSGSGTPVSMTLDRITTAWDWRTQPLGPRALDHERLWWVNRPSYTPLGDQPAPVAGEYWEADVTALYSDWKTGAVPNYGLQLRPHAVNNRFNQFASSEHVNPDWRPTLLIESPSLPGDLTLPASGGPGFRFEFPLQAAVGAGTYRLVTEAGGQSADPSPPAYENPFHTGGGHYSIDIVSEGQADVLAARSGFVVYVDADKSNFGPTVILYHGDGYFTEYREFTAPTVARGQHVTVGTSIGTYWRQDDGGPGTSEGGNNALHFQVKYNEKFIETGAVSGDWLSYLEDENAFRSNNGGLLPWDKTLGLSADAEGTPLRTIRLGERLLGQWQLNEVDGIPQNNSYYNRLGQPVTANGEAISGPITLDAWNGVNVGISGGVATLHENSPAFLWDTITIPLTANFLSFEYLWSGIGDGDALSVFFDDTLLFEILGTDFVGSEFLSSGPLWVTDFQGKTGQLLFELNSVGNSGAEVHIRNLQFLSSASVSSIPEPSTTLLLVPCIVILACLRRARRMQGSIVNIP